MTLPGPCAVSPRALVAHENRSLGSRGAREGTPSSWTLSGQCPQNEPPTAHFPKALGKGREAKLQGRARRRIWRDPLLLPRASAPGTAPSSAPPRQTPALPLSILWLELETIPWMLAAELPASPSAQQSASPSLQLIPPPVPGKSGRGEAPCEKRSSLSILRWEQGIFTDAIWEGSCVPLRASVSPCPLPSGLRREWRGPGGPSSSTGSAFRFHPNA